MTMDARHGGPPDPGRQQPDGRERLWAVVRIVLGLAQVMGATVAAWCLVQTGTSVLTLGAAAVTGLLVIVSKLLFRGPGPPGATE
jgi:hypothetical protein